MKLFDPSVLFILGCFSIPLALAQDNAERVRFITDPTLWGSMSLLAATLYLAKNHRSSDAAPLSKADERTAVWFLLNGAIIHIFMDGLMGVFKLCPPFQRHYAKLDVRYATSDATVDVVSLVELFLMGPASLILYYGIQTQRSWRYPVTILVSAFQLFGGILFVFTEVWWKGIHIPVDFNLEFTFDHILYFWFGFLIANAIWFIVPSYLIYDASVKLSIAMAAVTKSVATEIPAVSAAEKVLTKPSVQDSTASATTAAISVLQDEEEAPVAPRTPRRSSSRVRKTA